MNVQEQHYTNIGYEFTNVNHMKIGLYFTFTYTSSVGD